MSRHDGRLRPAGGSGSRPPGVESDLCDDRNTGCAQDPMLPAMISMSRITGEPDGFAQIEVWGGRAVLGVADEPRPSIVPGLLRGNGPGSPPGGITKTISQGHHRLGVNLTDS